MTSRVFPAFVGSLLLLLVFFIAPSQAQTWRQEVQIITPVGYGEPLHILTDSLIAVFTRNPDVLVRRKVQDLIPIPARQLREQLYDDGIDVNSATHALIRYRFELGRRSEIIETITDLYFIYRGSESQSDLPILYMSTQDPTIHTLLRTRGISSRVNLDAVNTFRDLLSFPYLTNRQETAMVEIARRSLRGDNPPPEQKALENFLTVQTRIGGGAYVLALPQPATKTSASTLSVSTPTATPLPQQ